MTTVRDKYKQIIDNSHELLNRGFDTVKNWSSENKWWEKIRDSLSTKAFNLHLLMQALSRETSKLHVQKDKLKNNLIDRIGKIINKTKKSGTKASTLVVYYMVLFLLIGGVTISTKKTIDNVKQKKEQKQEAKPNINNIEIDPNVSVEDWNLQMEAIWPYIYMETVLSEGFVDEAYADVGDTDGYLTIGSGFMIGKANPKGAKDREIIKERKAFFKKVLGKPYVNGVSISNEENKILIHEFYEKYIWSSMRKSFTRPMNAHLFIELCVGCFNRGSGVYKDKHDGANIRHAIDSGEDIEQIVNRFDDLCKSGFEGLTPKYGIAAHRALGNISDKDVLNSLANSVYQLSGKRMWGEGILQPYDSIASDLRNVSNSNVYKNGKTYVQHRLKYYMNQEEIDKIINGDLFIVSLEDLMPIAQKDETTVEQLNEQGEALYNSGDYDGAIEKFNTVIKLNPNMYIVYSNLSLAYYKKGEYESALDVIRNFIFSEQFKSAPATVKGYTYYNAALCYERLGDKAVDTEQKRNYYNSATKNAELAEKIANTKYIGFDKRMSKKISKLKKSKAVAFNDGIQKIKNMQNSENDFMHYINNNDYLA